MGTYVHETVLLGEMLEVYRHIGAGMVVDGTVGGGGFADRLLEETSEEVTLLGLDVDPDALAQSTSRLERHGQRARVMRSNYANLPALLKELKVACVMGAVLDLGISSNLLEGERGFSFRINAPLDMRMDPELPHTAGELIAQIHPGKLADLLRELGEIPSAIQLARALKQAQGQGKLETTFQLASVVRSTLPRLAGKIMAQVFQALRIAVNRELENLQRFLTDVPRLLCPSGRLAIISFHSLEDRMVKHAFRNLCETPEFRYGARKAVIPSAQEVEGNPRARSAKLRWIERVA